MNWPQEQASITEQYRGNGFVIAKQFIDSDQVSDIRARLDRYIQQVVPSLPPMDVFYEDKDARNQIRMLPRMHEHDSKFDNLLTAGPLREIAEHLFGIEAVPRDTAYFNKLPHIGEATPPHQDGYYFHLDPCEALTLWLSLDDVDEDNACVRYVPGSHRRGMRPHGRTEVLGFSQGITDYNDGDQSQEVPACVKPGDLIAHDAMTIHRTDANRSNRPRRALGFVYYSVRAKIDEDARDRYQTQLSQELAADGKI